MRCFTILLLSLVASVGSAQTPTEADDTSPHSDARLVADVSRIAAGDDFGVALEITVDPGWHTYWINSGDSGQPVTAEWTVNGGEAGPLRFPIPTRYDEAGMTTYIHDGLPGFVTRIETSDTATGEVTVTADARWLICADVCIPATQTVTLAVPVGETTQTDALDAIRAAHPTSGDEWTASAATTDGGYLLTVVPPDGVSLDGAHFFVDQKGVLDHVAPQRFQREGSAWAVRLAGSDYTQAPSDRLAGVLAVGETGVTLDIAVAGTEAAMVATPEASSLGWSSALLFAFLGGIILNLMPCVFPILGIKVLGFVNGRDDSPAELRAHGLAFGAGVVMSFLTLAGGLLALRAAGAGLARASRPRRGNWTDARG